MRKFFIIKFFCILIISFAVIKSDAQNNINLPNIAVYYNPTLTTLHPDYKVYFKSPDKATVYFRLYLPELNLVLSNSDYQAKVQIKYIFYKSLLSTEILDSASQVVTFQKKNIRQTIITFFDIDIPKENSYLVLITKDLYNQKKSIEIIYLDITDKSEQNYMLLNVEYVKPVFSNFVSPQKEYKIVHNKETDSFLVKKFSIDTTLATPPSSMLKTNFQPLLDTQFYHNSAENIFFEEKSIYCVENQQNNSQLTVMCFDKDFPDIKTSDKMVPPLQYITNSAEFKELSATPNKKLAIDNFWLSLNNDPNTAKSLIKLYYNRVIYANNHFTTTKQGWQTDRGMIYIVFGPPDILHIADNYQEWIYLDDYAKEQVNLIFEKKNLYFSVNDYILKRNIEYSAFWKEAVNSWKSGKFFVF